jgi:hypothetical protein
LQAHASIIVWSPSSALPSSAAPSALDVSWEYLPDRYAKAMHAPPSPPAAPQAKRDLAQRGHSTNHTASDEYFACAEADAAVTLVATIERALRTVDAARPFVLPTLVPQPCSAKAVVAQRAAPADSVLAVTESNSTLVHVESTKPKASTGVYDCWDVAKRQRAVFGSGPGALSAAMIDRTILNRLDLPIFSASLQGDVVRRVVCQSFRLRLCHSVAKATFALLRSQAFTVHSWNIDWLRERRLAWWTALGACAAEHFDISVVGTNVSGGLVGTIEYLSQVNQTGL